MVTIVDGVNITWKDLACKATSENSILWNELHIAMEQGYELSDAFKEYMERVNE